MPDTPLVSIVIPCYNSEKYVGEAIESALGQTYPNIEVIVIDDGSTDDSASIVECFLPRIKLRRQPNRGASAARNAGLRLAKGTFVKFQDADDVMLQTAIAAQVSRTAHLARFANMVLFGDVLVGDENLNLHPSESKNRDFDVGDQVSIDQAFEKTINTQAPLHKRALLLTVGGFNTNVRHFEDFELIVRMVLKGTRFVYYPDPCVIYRQHEGVHRISSSFCIWDVVDCLDSLLVDSNKYAMSTRIDRQIARQYWAVGRRALRLGLPDVADECFHKARFICPSDPTCGSVLYRLLVSICGPRATERMAGVKWLLRLRARELSSSSRAMGAS